MGVLEPFPMVTEGEAGMLPGYCSLLCCRVFPDLFNILKNARDASMMRASPDSNIKTASKPHDWPRATGGGLSRVLGGQDFT